MKKPQLVSREGRDYMRFPDGEELLVLNRDLLAEEHRKRRDFVTATACPKGTDSSVAIIRTHASNEGYKALVSLKHEHAASSEAREADIDPFKRHAASLISEQLAYISL